MLKPPERTRDLRSSDQNVLFSPQIKTKKNKGSFSMAAQLWNHLPSEIRTSKTVHSFRKNIKKKNFNQAFPTWFFCILACSVGDPE